MEKKNKMIGAIVGMMLGDAMGMPGELWPKERIRSELGFINCFKDGVADNEVSCYFKAGQFTDDSSQALVFLDVLDKYHTVPDVEIVAKNLLNWVYRENGFEKNLLGTSSKAALLAHAKNEKYEHITSKAESNGAAMRITPLGCLINSIEKEKLAKAVYLISRATHSSDVTIAGAAMIAQGVSSAIDGKNFDEILEDIYSIHDIAIKYGSPTFSANCKARLKVGINLVKECKTDNDLLEMVYKVIGTGLLTSESVPAAIILAYYARDPEKAAILAANLGGDTDTIGAMAGGICGAYTGIEGIRKEWIDKLEEANQIDFKYLTKKIVRIRKDFYI